MRYRAAYLYCVYIYHSLILSKRLIREQSLSLTRTGAEGNQQGYEIFCMRFAGV